MPLSSDQVNQAYASLVARATTAIDSLEQQKTFMGSVMGNNDTIEQSEGALRMTRDNQMPGWKQNGLDLAGQGDDANPSKVQGWVDLGQTFAKSISEIDGYGQDATLASVVAATASKTADDIKEKVVPALAFGFGGAMALAIVGAVLYVTVILKK